MFKGNLISMLIEELKTNEFLYEVLIMFLAIIVSLLPLILVVGLWQK